MLSEEDINNRFGFHKATLEGVEATKPKHETLRTDFMSFASMLNHILPEGREKSLALTALEEASMWSHKSIASRAALEDEVDSSIAEGRRLWAEKRDRLHHQVLNEWASGSKIPQIAAELNVSESAVRHILKEVK